MALRAVHPPYLLIGPVCAGHGGTSGKVPHVVRTLFPTTVPRDFDCLLDSSQMPEPEGNLKLEPGICRSACVTNQRLGLSSGRLVMNDWCLCEAGPVLSA